MSDSASRRPSIHTMAFSLCRNHGSMPDIWDSSSGVAPRRREASTAQRRSSVGMPTKSRGSMSRQAASSQSRERPPNSRERTALPKAASKLRSIAITSPVAFIWVPVRRSPSGNLSNGQRGIFTTT